MNPKKKKLTELNVFKYLIVLILLKIQDCLETKPLPLLEGKGTLPLVPVPALVKKKSCFPNASDNLT
jgi:hypothetical protein